MVYYNEVIQLKPGHLLNLAPSYSTSDPLNEVHFFIYRFPNDDRTNSLHGMNHPKLVSLSDSGIIIGM